MTFLGSVSGGVFWAGIFFMTAQRYGFSPARNLALAATMGVIYAIAASLSGRLDRAAAPRVGSRAVLAATLAVWAAAAFAPVAFPGVEAVLWAAAVVGAAGSALTWPIVESYVSSGRHGAQMRAAIGWFNLTWTPAVALPLVIFPLLAGAANPAWTVGLAGMTNAAALLAALALPRQPAPHAPEAAEAAIGREYPALLRSASRLLPLSYVLLSTVSPVLPHRLREIDAGAIPASIVAATWMLARFATLLVMSRLHVWHGRWGALAAGAGALAGGLALVLLGTSLSTVVAGLAVFGVGMGLTYYAAIYYTLAVGRAAVEAGGSFEALIGLGYTVGPLLGLAGHAVATGARAGSTTVALAWAVAAAVSAGALAPYLAARRARRHP